MTNMKHEWLERHGLTWTSLKLQLKRLKIAADEIVRSLWSDEDTVTFLKLLHETNKCHFSIRFSVLASAGALFFFCFSHVPPPFLSVCMCVYVCYGRDSMGTWRSYTPVLNVPINPWLKYSRLPVTCQQIISYPMWGSISGHHLLPLSLVHPVLCDY